LSASVSLSHVPQLAAIEGLAVPAPDTPGGQVPGDTPQRMPGLDPLEHLPTVFGDRQRDGEGHEDEAHASTTGRSGTAHPDRPRHHCTNATCRNSGFVAHKLTELGYSDVYHYPGRQAGLATGRPPRGDRTGHTTGSAGPPAVGTIDDTCALDPAQLDERLNDWRTMAAQAAQQTPVDGGLELAWRWVLGRGLSVDPEDPLLELT
jgi:hypothetical protein